MLFSTQIVISLHLQFWHFRPSFELMWNILASQSNLGAYGYDY